jgi:hypothetical protein
MRPSANSDRGQPTGDRDAEAPCSRWPHPIATASPRTAPWSGSGVAQKAEPLIGYWFRPVPRRLPSQNGIGLDLDIHPVRKSAVDAAEQTEAHPMCQAAKEAGPSEIWYWVVHPTCSCSSQMPSAFWNSAVGTSALPSVQRKPLSGSNW